MINLKLLSKSIDSVENGETCPLELDLELRELAILIQAAQAQIKGFVVDEVQLHGTKNVNGFNYTFKKGAKKWTHKTSKIVTFETLNKEKLRLYKSEAEQAYQRAVKGLEPLIDSDTGEVIEPAELSYLRDTYSVTKAKI